ncbi:hypothetical protein WMY93_022653 [Mugilogobius chulae]|uniref:PiggyBac transposable element-derived protein domain-containing protein n=1 Tax=Mugilogobius chulae TaxID=88201 RepID=A0AAW0NJV1_9GOBI
MMDEILRQRSIVTSLSSVINSIGDDEEVEDREDDGEDNGTDSSHWSELGEGEEEDDDSGDDSGENSGGEDENDEDYLPERSTTRQRPRSPSPPAQLVKEEELSHSSVQPTSSTCSQSSVPTCTSERGRTAQRGKATQKRSRRRIPASAPLPEWQRSNWQPKDIPFTASPGLAGAAATMDSDKPVDFVELFLTDEFIDNIVKQTNLYAQQSIEAAQRHSVHSRTQAWKPVTVPEMKKFLGLIFLTGIVKKPELEMYWSTDEVLSTPYYSKVMSRNRFQIILRFLHFNDNNAVQADNTDKLHKIRPVVDYLISKFKELYQPAKNISIDEGMLLWRGRLVFKVYNPLKPVKYGIKSYILCDSQTGYCFNMKPYAGESTPLGDTVVQLLDRLSGHGYKLYMDNYYNSVSLCQRLLHLKTHVCGTLRKNRGEPEDFQTLTKAELKNGQG